MDNKENLSVQDQALQEQEKKQRDARNKKIFIFSAAGLAAILIAVGAVLLIRHNGSSKQDEKIALADIETNDSVRFQMYKQIADDGSYKANERAQLMVAIRYYNDSNYTAALEYLDKPSVSSPIVEAGIYSLKGDCYANLNKLDDALEMFEKAVNAADDNPVITPFILAKQANIYAAKKDYAKELDCYTTIRRDYPDFMPDVDKYYERAKARAGK